MWSISYFIIKSNICNIIKYGNLLKSYSSQRFVCQDHLVLKKFICGQQFSFYPNQISKWLLNKPYKEGYKINQLKCKIYKFVKYRDEPWIFLFVIFWHVTKLIVTEGWSYLVHPSKTLYRFSTVWSSCQSCV